MLSHVKGWLRIHLDRIEDDTAHLRLELVDAKTGEVIVDMPEPGSTIELSCGDQLTLEKASVRWTSGVVGRKSSVSKV